MAFATKGSFTMATKEKMLTATFQNRTTANRAFNWLHERGYMPDEINVLMSDKTRAAYAQEEVKQGDNPVGSKASEGVAAGGAVGTVVGASIAAILAIGTAVAVPGIGWVAGPLIAAFAGGGAGAVVGGAAGGLIGLGISESNAKAYEEALRKGGIVLGVVPRSSEDAKHIQKYFEAQKADNIVYA
jgi:hypothetical protein